MALWKFDQNTAKLYRKQAKKPPTRKLIQHNSFFISDKGGARGVKIDFVERRQAAQAMNGSKLSDPSRE